MTDRLFVFIRYSDAADGKLKHLSNEGLTASAAAGDPPRSPGDILPIFATAGTPGIIQFPGKDENIPGSFKPGKLFMLFGKLWIGGVFVVSLKVPPLLTPFLTSFPLSDVTAVGEHGDVMVVAGVLLGLPFELCSSPFVLWIASVGCGRWHDIAKGETDPVLPSDLSLLEERSNTPTCSIACTT